MRPILITGATGFIGDHLARRLLRRGARLRLMVRDPGRLHPLLRSRTDVVAGGLGDADAARYAMRGVGQVLHLAALAKAFARDEGEYDRLNRRAVEVLLDAADAAGVERFVHVSTVAVLPPEGTAGAGTTPYAASKAASEEAVLRYVAAGHDAVIVRPSRVYGPGPRCDANGATRLVDLYRRGRLRCRPDDGGVLANWVHVEDVAAGIELAARYGRRGAAYDLGGEDASLSDYLEIVTGIDGRRRAVAVLPVRLCRAAAHAGQLWGRLGGRTSLTPAWLDYFLENRPVDSGLAHVELGYEPRSLRAGLRETIAWLDRQEKGAWHVDAEGIPGHHRA
jgi:farnesol dehydrogenase